MISANAASTRAMIWPTVSQLVLPADVEEVVRLAQLEVVEEDLALLVVVALPGVHGDVLGRLVERGQDPGQADDLRAAAEDGDDLHAGSPGLSTGRKTVSGWASSNTWLDQNNVTRSPGPTFSMAWA